MVDLSLRPSCRSVLLLHAQRANYVAKLWRFSLTSFSEMTPIFENGWNNDGTILCVNEVFPSDVTYILCDPNFENENECFVEDIVSSDDEFKADFHLTFLRYGTGWDRYGMGLLVT